VTELLEAQVDCGSGETGEAHPNVHLVAAELGGVLEPGEWVLDVVALGVECLVPRALTALLARPRSLETALIER
jgi:hypothetical protein